MDDKYKMTFVNTEHLQEEFYDGISLEADIHTRLAN